MMKKSKVTSRSINWSILLIAVALTSYILYLTPMQSDDFSYYNMGLGLEAHINHYKGWSGRFIADYISPLLLHLPSISLRSIIIAIVAVAMIFLISRLPSLVFNQRYSIGSFVTLFGLYWVMNPTLGQTLLWVVGSANYLFTNFFVVLYLYLFVRYVKNPNHTLLFISLLLISSVVGFSSENVAWIIFLFSLISSAALYRARADKKIWLSFILVALSFSFMLFSPGNAARASHSAFTDFYAQSFFTRLFNFVAYTYPTALARKSPLLIVILILYSILVRRGAPKLLKNSVALLVLVSLLSSFSMVMAPGFAPRALSGPVLFLLLAISILLHSLFNQERWGDSRLFKLLLGVVGVLFITSYSLVSYAYQRLHLQFNLIEQEIMIAKQQGYDRLTLPSYYYVGSLRRHESPDDYLSTSAMANYYGLKSIQIMPMDFDYSILLTGELKAVEQENSLFIGYYLEPSGFLFGRKGSTVVFVSSEPLNAPQENIHFIVTLKSGEIVEHSAPLNTITLDGQSVLGFHIDEKRSEVESINVINESKVQVSEY